MRASDATRPPELPFTRADIDQSVSARFEQVAARFADCVAVVANGKRLTYHELNGHAGSIARAIQARTAPGRGCVAFLVDHSPHMVACPLGVLKAGKVQLAIHPHMPAAAQRDIVRDAVPEMIVTSAAMEARAREIAEGSFPILVLDEIDPHSAAASSTIAAGPDDLATLFYTSGTTGQPKGVMKSHRAVMHRIWLLGQHDAIVPADRQSLLTYCSFAASEADLFGALLYGATLCLFDIVSKGLEEFGDWINAEQITVLHPPAFLFRRFLSTLEGEALFPSVRLVALAGDVVLPADIEKWRRHFSKGCTLTHRFSTTETALLAVERIAHDAPVEPAFVPAGRPVADKRLVLVDPEGQPVAPGETGELVVKSKYISQGYWRRLEETAAAFQPDPDCPGARMYRTGDLGRFLEDGRFAFGGRRDHQVKIRGYRVETREVEAALLQLDGVREAAVLVQRENGEPRLVAFVVLDPARAWDGAAFRGRLRGLLPDWKMPAAIQPIASLPTTLTGKIDRQKLAAGIIPEPAVASRVAPRTKIEARLAALWRDVLELNDVGVHDDFFERGGDSLKAVTLLSRIKSALGRELPLNTFLSAATIAGMAELIFTPLRENSAIVRIKPGSETPSLYVIPDWTSSHLFWLRFLPHLSPGQALLGLRFPESDGVVLPIDDFTGLAARFADQLCAEAPDGEFYLAGYSWGGFMAHEVARQLHRRERRVAFLGIIDTAAEQLPQRFQEGLLSFLRRVRKTVSRRIKSRSARNGSQNLPEGLARFRRSAQAARNRFMPQPYPGRITLLRTRSPRHGAGPHDYGWGRLADQVDVRIVAECRHHQMVKAPYVEHVARALQAAVDDARSRVCSPT